MPHNNTKTGTPSSGMQINSILTASSPLKQYKALVAQYKALVTTLGLVSKGDPSHQGAVQQYTFRLQYELYSSRRVGCPSGEFFGCDI